MNTILLQPETTLASDDLHVLHRHIEFSENARLILTTGYSRKPRLLTHIVPQSGHATVGFNFCVKGTANFFNKGKYSPARADEQSVNHILFPRVETSCHLEVEGAFSHALFCIGKDRYFNLLDAYAELQPKGFLRAAEKSGYCFFNKNNWTPAFRHVTSQLLQNQMTGLSGKLFFESKMLEVTALLLDAYRKKPIEYKKPDHTERDKMQHVRELLEQNLSDPPSLAKLARLAGTNEFALKKHFKETFGVPVFKYLQQLRLDKAHQLFSSTDLQVGTVAMEVGYDSVSAFSRAFKDRFGIQPQLVR